MGRLLVMGMVFMIGTVFVKHKILVSRIFVMSRVLVRGKVLVVTNNHFGLNFLLISFLHFFVFVSRISSGYFEGSTFEKMEDLQR